MVLRLHLKNHSYSDHVHDLNTGKVKVLLYILHFGSPGFDSSLCPSLYKNFSKNYFQTLKKIVLLNMLRLISDRQI